MEDRFYNFVASECQPYYVDLRFVILALTLILDS